MKLEPASSIVSRFGGVKRTSEAAGVYRTRVYAWMLPKEKGGTGGTIPQRHHVPLLDAARAADIPLTAADFLPSHKEGEQ